MKGKMTYFLLILISVLFSSCSQSSFIAQEEKYVTQFGLMKNSGV